MQTATAIEQYKAEYRKSLERLKDMGEDIADATLDSVADEQVQAVKQVMCNGYDNGGVAKNVVPVQGIEKRDTGWYYITEAGAYRIRVN